MLKNRKAAGLDDICVELIKEFGTKTKQWILELFNEIRSTYKLPKIWRKAQIIALLKPGKQVPKTSGRYHFYVTYIKLSKEWSTIA